jgi:hypothetical protein
MSKRRKKPKAEKRKGETKPRPAMGARTLYEQALRSAATGDPAEARRIYAALAKDLPDPRLKALVLNDQATLAVLAGDREAALRLLREALLIDPQSQVTRFNLSFLEDEITEVSVEQPASAHKEVPAEPSQPEGSGKVAILSFLFNWPTSGGGNVHTAELARFLAEAGYTVRHFYPRFAPWGIGNVAAPPFPSEGLEFSEQDWTIPSIQARFRQAVDAFGPDTCQGRKTRRMPNTEGAPPAGAQLFIPVSCSSHQPIFMLPP